MRAGADAIDRDAFQWFLRNTSQRSLDIEPERLLHSWRLVSGEHPTVAGIVLFGRDPQSILPFAQINAARIPGTEIANDPSDRKDLRGQLLNVIEDTIVSCICICRCPTGFAAWNRNRSPSCRKCVAGSGRECGRPPRLHRARSCPALDFRRQAPHLRTSFRCGAGDSAGSGIPRMARLVKQATGREKEIRIADAEMLLRIPRKISRREAQSIAPSPSVRLGAEILIPLDIVSGAADEHDVGASITVNVSHLAS